MSGKFHLDQTLDQTLLKLSLYQDKTAANHKTKDNFEKYRVGSSNILIILNWLNFFLT